MTGIRKDVSHFSGKLAVCTFGLSFLAGAASKFLIKPAWSEKYRVKWSDDLGTLQTNLSYGEGEANIFDLYLPREKNRSRYGLAVYLHGGGFTSGDKSDDQGILSWLCSKGYVAAGINYTLRDENHPTASVFSQSEEIKAAVPKVIEAARAAGYPIDRMTVAGGSAGHTLAMLYAYRDGKDAPVPVVFTFGGVGPSCFYREDWKCYGLDKNTLESEQAARDLFGAMLGQKLSLDEIKNGSYLEKMKPVSAVNWVSHNPVPTVVAYGKYDRIQPFQASLRLKKALEDNQIDHVYLEFPHSGHGLQNDDAMSKKWMEAIESRLDFYMPLNEGM